MLWQIVSPHEFVYERPEPHVMAFLIALAAAVVLLDRFGGRL